MSYSSTSTSFTSGTWTETADRPAPPLCMSGTRIERYIVRRRVYKVGARTRDWGRRYKRSGGTLLICECARKMLSWCYICFSTGSEYWFYDINTHETLHTRYMDSCVSFYSLLLCASSLSPVTILSCWWTRQLLVSPAQISLATILFCYWSLLLLLSFATALSCYCSICYCSLLQLLSFANSLSCY